MSVSVKSRVKAKVKPLINKVLFAFGLRKTELIMHFGILTLFELKTQKRLWLMLSQMIEKH